MAKTPGSGSGHYTAEPHLYEEYFCGNCDSAITAVRAMRGFVIDARALVIRSPRLGAAVLETRAGYGVLILKLCAGRRWKISSSRVDGATRTGKPRTARWWRRTRG